MKTSFYAIHGPGEVPDQHFPTRQEAAAFILGYSYGCCGNTRACEGAQAEWVIQEMGERPDYSNHESDFERFVKENPRERFVDIRRESSR